MSLKRTTYGVLNREINFAFMEVLSNGIKSECYE